MWLYMAVAIGLVLLFTADLHPKQSFGYGQRSSDNPKDWHMTYEEWKDGQRRN